MKETRARSFVDVGGGDTISVMVMEHVEDDFGFVQSVEKRVRPGGHVAICVPRRKDH